MLDPNTGHSLNTSAEKRLWDEPAYSGTFSEQAARKGDDEECGGSTGGERKPTINYAGLRRPTKPALLRRGVAGVPLMFSHEAVPSAAWLFWDPLRRPSSRCTTEEDLVSDNKAGQSLTGQCPFSPNTGWATRVRDPQEFQSGPSPGTREGPLQRRQLQNCTPDAHLGRLTIKEESSPSLRRPSCRGKDRGSRSLQGRILTAAKPVTRKES